MSEINNESVESEVDVDLDNEADQFDDSNENPPKKEIPTETPEAKRARLTRQLAQLDKKFPVEKTEKKVESKKSKEQGLGYGEKAFLVANGIKGSDEMDLVEEIMGATCRSLEDVIESRHFQATLQELRDNRASADAIPKGSKRSSQTQTDQVEYWIAKGELPPANQRELRAKVVNARIKAQRDGNVFTDTPVAGK